jgi:hypothetical protein
MRRSFIFSCVLLLTSAVAYSQSFYAIRRERSLIANAGIGSANYFGELTNPRELGVVRYGFNFGLEKYLTNRIAFRGELAYYQISGDDAKADDDRVVRNLSFVSNNFEATTVGIVDLLPHGLRFYQRPVLNFYGFVGVGVTYINPKTEYNGEMVALHPLQTEAVKYSKWQFIIPAGGGVKLKVGPFFNVAIEGGVRKTFTDYLDDISVKRYPDPAILSSDLSRALSDRSGGEASVRGNPEADDWYFMMTAKIQYYLPFDIGNSNRKLYTKKRKAMKYNRRPSRR